MKSVSNQVKSLIATRFIKVAKTKIIEQFGYVDVELKIPNISKEMFNNTLSLEDTSFMINGEKFILTNAEIIFNNCYIDSFDPENANHSFEIHCDIDISLDSFLDDFLKEENSIFA